MSYILDALKKAEAERRLGSVPDMHAQPTPAAAPPPASPAWRSPWTGIALAALILAVAAVIGLWQQAGSKTAVPAPAASSAASPLPVAAPPADNKPAEIAQTPALPSTPEPARAGSGKKPSRASEPKAAATAKPAPEESRILAMRELPEHIQRELPVMTVSGYIYSRNKADRSVLVNRKLLREGDQVAPDLTLETLTPSGMVLNYKGYRYRASY